MENSADIKVRWYVTDIWEVFCPIPVTFDGDVLIWDLGGGHCETFTDYETGRLCTTAKQAVALANALNKRVVEGRQVETY